MFLSYGVCRLLFLISKTTGLTETVKIALRVNQLKEGLTPEGVGGVLPYMGYVSLCGCEGYSFQAVYSRTGFINQGVWVYNRELFFTKLASWLEILFRLRKPGIAPQISKKKQQQQIGRV